MNICFESSFEVTTFFHQNLDMVIEHYRAVYFVQTSSGPFETTKLSAQRQRVGKTPQRTLIEPPCLFLDMRPSDNGSPIYHYISTSSHAVGELIRSCNNLKVPKDRISFCLTMPSKFSSQMWKRRVKYAMLCL